MSTPDCFDAETPSFGSASSSSATGSAAARGKLSFSAASDCAAKVDEKLFCSFDDCQPRPVHSESDLLRDFSSIVKTLADVNQDWELRVASLRAVRSLLNGGSVSQFPKQWAACLKTLVEPLCLNIKDLRSGVMREACITLSHMAVVLRSEYLGGSAVVDTFTSVLFKQIAAGVRVMSDSASYCLKQFVAHVQDPKVLGVITETASTHKAALIRSRCAENLVLVLSTWDTAKFERLQSNIEACICKCLRDADPGVRVSARRAYWNLDACAHESAQSLLKTLEPSVVKHIMEERNRMALSASLVGTGVSGPVAPQEKKSVPAPTQRAAQQQQQQPLQKTISAPSSLGLAAAAQQGQSVAATPTLARARTLANVPAHTPVSTPATASVSVSWAANTAAATTPASHASDHRKASRIMKTPSTTGTSASAPVASGQDGTRVLGVAPTQTPAQTPASGPQAKRASRVTTTTTTTASAVALPPLSSSTKATKATNAAALPGSVACLPSSVNCPASGRDQVAAVAVVDDLIVFDSEPAPSNKDSHHSATLASAHFVSMTQPAARVAQSFEPSLVEKRAFDYADFFESPQPERAEDNADAPWSQSLASSSDCLKDTKDTHDAETAPFVLQASGSTLPSVVEPVQGQDDAENGKENEAPEAMSLKPPTFLVQPTVMHGGVSILSATQTQTAPRAPLAVKEATPREKLASVAGEFPWGLPESVDGALAQITACFEIMSDKTRNTVAHVAAVQVLCEIVIVFGVGLEPFLIQQSVCNCILMLELPSRDRACVVEEAVKQLLAFVSPSAQLELIQEMLQTHATLSVPTLLFLYKLQSGLFSKQSAAELAASLPVYVSSLVNGYKHSAAEIRKTVVFQIVELVKKIGRDTLQPLFSQLNSMQMRLLQVYIDRAKDSSIGSSCASGESGLAIETSKSSVAQ